MIEAPALFLAAPLSDDNGALSRRLMSARAVRWMLLSADNIHRARTHFVGEWGRLSHPRRTSRQARGGAF